MKAIRHKWKPFVYANLEGAVGGIDADDAAPDDDYDVVDDVSMS